MSARPSDLIAVLPKDSGSVGGIQASAALAAAALKEWDGCSQIVRVAPRPQRTVLGRVPPAVASSVQVQWAGRMGGPMFLWHSGFLRSLDPLIRSRHARVSLFLHGIEAWHPQDRWTESLLPKVQFFLTNSDHTWEGFTNCRPELLDAPQRTVALGAGEAIKQVSEPASAPRAVMLGRLLLSENYKGHREVIDAWPHVLRTIPDANLDIAGDGDLIPALRVQIDRLGVADSVHLLGRVSEQEKAHLIRSSRCLLLPSRGEGFGLVYLEAMREGRPCLVSNRDAGREVVAPPEAGLEVTLDDPSDLVDRICRLLSPGEDWDRMAQTARLRYERLYTAEAFQRRLISALDDWLTHPQRR